MKLFLALVVVVAVMYIVLVGRSPIHPSAATPTPRPAASAPATMAPVVYVPPAAAPPGILPYKILLRPLYVALADATVRATNLKDLNPEAGALHALISSVPQTPERDAALRLCVIVGQAATITHTVAERNNRPGSKSSLSTNNPRGEDEAAAREAFFQQAGDKQWRGQIAPMQAAARDEWARIPDRANFSSPDLAAYLASRQTRQHTATASPLYFTVVQILPQGSVVQPFESYVIASSPGATPARTGIGLATPATTGYRPASRPIFLEGFYNGNEGATATVMAYRDGVYTFTDPSKGTRTMEKWVFVRNGKQ